jgi:cellulose synthase/poly-beta-1,6-N-acetylglucosamine synthase-like glycosyltransferase
MKMSFVIPAYNEEAYIGACVRSARREIRACGCDGEIIVVDNASTDHTAAVASAWPDVRVVFEPRKGLLFARQRGFEESCGDLLACIDADTIVPRGWIGRAMREFARNPRLACLSGPYVYYDLSSAVRVIVTLWYLVALLFLGYINQYLFRTGAMVQGGNYVVRRSALEKIGGYNTGIAFYGEDTDLARRLIRVGKVRFTPRLSLPASGRRLRKEGVFQTGVAYALNGLSVLTRGRPSTQKYTDIRESATRIRAVGGGGFHLAD